MIRPLYWLERQHRALIREWNRGTIAGALLLLVLVALYLNGAYLLFFQIIPAWWGGLFTGQPLSWIGLLLLVNLTIKEFQK